MSRLKSHGPRSFLQILLVGQCLQACNVCTTTSTAWAFNSLLSRQKARPRVSCACCQATEESHQKHQTRVVYQGSRTKRQRLLAKVLVAAVLQPMPTHAQCSSPCSRLTRSVRWWARHHNNLQNSSGGVYGHSTSVEQRAKARTDRSTKDGVRPMVLDGGRVQPQSALS